MNQRVVDFKTVISPCLVIFLVISLAGCARTTQSLDLPRVDTFGQLPKVRQLEGQTMVVLSPLSLQTVLKLDKSEILQRYRDSRLEQGKDTIPLLDIHLINNSPSILSVSARYPYLLAGALAQVGIDAHPSDVLDLPAGLKDAGKEEICSTFREMGYSWVLIAGLERPVEPGAKMYIREEHYGKSLVGEIVTMGMNPVRTHTYGVHYARDYELLSTAPGGETFMFTLETLHRYDETADILSGFRIGQRMLLDSENAQVQEVPSALNELNGLELRESGV